MKPAAKPDPSVVCPGAPRRSPEQRSTPIDGVWVMNSSLADVSAAERAADPNVVKAENLGHWNSP